MSSPTWPYICLECGRHEPEHAATCTRPEWVPDPREAEARRRGKQARNYGTRAELQAARKYGGVKVGHIGGPVDIEGRDFATQMRTRRQLPPAEWRKAFAAMTGDKCPRLLIRFLPGPGLPPQDFFVFPAGAFLDWFGRDDG